MVLDTNQPLVEERWERQLRHKHERYLNRGFNYESRAHNLKLIGFRNYQEYLASPLWRRIRARVFAYKGHSCWLCNQEATAVHHNRYRVKDLAGRTLKNLFPICDKCHEEIEYTKKGKKLEPGSVQNRFMEKERIVREHICWLLLNFGDDVAEPNYNAV